MRKKHPTYPLLNLALAAVFAAGVFSILTCGNTSGETAVTEAAPLPLLAEPENPPEPETVPEPEAVFPLPLPCGFSVKSGPPEAGLFLGESELLPLSEAAGIRTFLLETAGAPLTVRHPGYRTREIDPETLAGAVRSGLMEIKLEPDSGPLSLVTELPTGRQPKSAVFSPDGTRIFIPLLDEHGIDVFGFSEEAGRTPVLRYETRLKVPESQSRGFVEPLADERRRELWVSNMEDHEIHIFDLHSLTFIDSISSGGAMPKVIVQNPQGSITAVSNWQSKTVSLIDPETRKITARIPTGGTPRGMVFSPDGTLLYTAIFDEPAVAVIDTVLGKVTARYRLYEGAGAARHILYSAGKLYVSDMARGTVNILDAATGKLLRSRRVGPNINTIAFSPDKGRIFVSSRGRNNPEDYTLPGPDFGTLSVLDARDLSPQGRVWGRNQPTGLAVSPDGKYLVFTDFLDANLELYQIGE
ncbi:YncE family protein [Breznakiella homolactica]|uniref:YncE family protein n=1 Tax=Breznakiella homolactica TaxID=2798577 RepID=A0A7T7XR01_9SPIR|nr:YncE family protein [Breznakiella homolactica]QQO10890.1 YncE family protein [Breznakiella homolactica]